MWSCMLWMVRDRRRYAMISSPFMVAYGNLLIVLQYIWSFENMEPISGLFVKKNNPFHSLSSKVKMHSQGILGILTLPCIFCFLLLHSSIRSLLDSQTKHCYVMKGSLVFGDVLDLLKGFQVGSFWDWPVCVQNEVLYVNRPPKTCSCNVFWAHPGYCFVKPSMRSCLQRAEMQLYFMPESNCIFVLS